jgi:hypothetical protein
MVRNFVVMYNKFNVEEICISVISFSKNMDDDYYIILYYSYYLICTQREFFRWQIKLNYMSRLSSYRIANIFV